MRADAKRNYALILAVAEEEVATHGGAASLEQIARTAGVGSATVRRHFPTRLALLAAVSKERIEALKVRAQELTTAPDSRTALLAWLADVLAYCVTARGLAAALAYDGDPLAENSCATALEEAGEPLLARARRDGAARDDVTLKDLITVIVGIVLVSEQRPGQAERLFALVVAGLSPR